MRVKGKESSKFWVWNLRLSGRVGNGFGWFEDGRGERRGRHYSMRGVAGL